MKSDHKQLGKEHPHRSSITDEVHNLSQCDAICGHGFSSDERATLLGLLADTEKGRRTIMSALELLGMEQEDNDSADC